MSKNQLQEFCTFASGGKLKLTKRDYVSAGFPAFSAAGQDGFLEQWEYDQPAIVVSSIGARCGKAFLANGRWTSLANTYLVFPNVSRAVPEFLYYQLNDEDSWIRSGSAQPFIKPSDIKSRTVFLPPIEEQRRIVDILNRAARIERLNARASAHLRDFIPALFLKMFGDPIENLMGWPVEKLASLVVDGARNGLSPSRKGLVRGEVLTLSAITRGAFDPTAHKEGTFSHPIPAEQIVTKDRFLLCRGNGNLDLVGRGHFPSIDMPGIAFPDTIIAVEPRKDRVEPAFLEALWETRYIREQVERAAKTTNGTYKINQGSLLDFQIPVPPIADQRKFAALVASAKSRMALATSSAELASDLSRSLLDKLLGADGITRVDPENGAPDVLAV